MTGPAEKLPIRNGEDHCSGQRNANNTTCGAKSLSSSNPGGLPPSKHVEFSHIESRHYVGYGHHRWIYTLADGELRVIAKFPLASFYSPRRALLMKLRQALIDGSQHMRDAGPLPWWDERLGGPGNELAFIWQGDLRYRVINGDHSGESNHALARMYREELAQGL